MDGISIQPERLAASGKGLEELATRFATMLSAFQAELAAFGQPWGGDDIGMLIGTAHDEVSAWAFECYGAALEEIGQAGFDLTGMAASYTAIEATNQQRFEKLHQGLGG